MAAAPVLPFLRIPPFPGNRAAPLTAPGTTTVDAEQVADALVQERVGGSFWGARPDLPAGCTLVLAPDSNAQLREMLDAAKGERPVLLAAKGIRAPSDMPNIAGDIDPWHLASEAPAIWSGAGEELALVAALAGKRVRLFGEGPFSGCDTDPAAALARVVGACRYADPFHASDWTVEAAIAQLGAWRRLIDSNRGIDAVYGVAAWKRVTLNPLLWNGLAPVPHRRTLGSGKALPRHALAWKSRTSPDLLNTLETRHVPVGEIEDGFIRSAGLGANCVPPLSAIIDYAGVYFDPATPSDLENILQYSEIDDELCRRAHALRGQIVSGAISKYAQGTVTFERQVNKKRQILVTGQVEDDRSILSGGGNISNIRLLSQVRHLEGDAWIIYKPHPDVEAGHRKGHVPEVEARRFADEVQRDAPITALIDAVDAVHVITSLAGFEALLRGKPVTTHGVPFYAGWGLTRDLGPVPGRRTRRRSLDELVAATLLLYPRYIDPVTRLPCPAEVLVERMAAGAASISSPLVRLRTWQGRLNALLRRSVNR